MKMSIKMRALVAITLTLLLFGVLSPVAAIPGEIKDQNGEPRWSCTRLDYTMKCSDKTKPNPSPTPSNPAPFEEYVCVESSWGWSCEPQGGGATQDGARELEAALNDPNNAPNIPPDPKRVTDASSTTTSSTTTTTTTPSGGGGGVGSFDPNIPCTFHFAMSFSECYE